VPSLLHRVDRFKKIIEALAKETREHWANQPARLLNRSNDLGKRAAIEQAELKATNIRFWR
jgi:hypothetical protein